jgi:hypothetical protein
MAGGRGNPYLIKSSEDKMWQFVLRGVIFQRQPRKKTEGLPLWWFALDTTFPHKVTINIIINSFPFVAFCKYLLLILQIKKK